MENRRKLDTNRWEFVSWLLCHREKICLEWINVTQEQHRRMDGGKNISCYSFLRYNVMRVHDSKCKIMEIKIMQKVFIPFNYRSLPDKISHWMDLMLLQFYIFLLRSTWYCIMLAFLTILSLFYYFILNRKHLFQFIEY